MIKIEDAVQVIHFASLEFRRGEQKVDMICNNWKKKKSGRWANFIIEEIKISRANCKRKSVSLEKKLGSRSYKLENESAKNEHKFYHAMLHVTFNQCQKKNEGKHMTEWSKKENKRWSEKRYKLKNASASLPLKKSAKN